MKSPVSSTWLPQLGLLFISLAVATGGAELVLRTFLPVRGMIYRLDDRYLFTHIPGSRKLASPGGRAWPKVLVKINESGRRGEEQIGPPPRHRIVVYGDSFVSAEYTSEPQTYVARLARLLTDRAGPVQVLNAGVTGYGVDQEVLRMEDGLAALKPELVVIAVYAGNDFGDLLRDKLFRLDEAGELRRNVPTLSPQLRHEFSDPFPFSSIQLVRLVHSFYQQWGPRPPSPVNLGNSTSTRLANRVAEYEDYIVKGDDEVTNLLADEYDADVSLTPNSPSAMYRLALMRRVLERAALIAKKNGSGLFLLIIPERCDVTQDCDVSRERREHPSYRPSGLTDALQSIAETSGIPFVNLYEPFRNGGGAALYYPVDEHWNASGQDLAARLSADAIVRGGQILN